LLFTVTFIASVLTRQAVNETAPLPSPVLTELPASPRSELQRAYHTGAANPADPAAIGQLGMLLHAEAGNWTKDSDR
jgi:hypothetical protein